MEVDHDDADKPPQSGAPRGRGAAAKSAISEKTSKANPKPSSKPTSTRQQFERDFDDGGGDDQSMDGHEEDISGFNLETEAVSFLTKRTSSAGKSQAARQKQIIETRRHHTPSRLDEEDDRWSASPPARITLIDNDEDVESTLRSPPRSNRQRHNQSPSYNEETQLEPPPTPPPHKTKGHKRVVSLPLLSSQKLVPPSPSPLEGSSRVTKHRNEVPSWPNSHPPKSGTRSSSVSNSKQKSVDEDMDEEDGAEQGSAGPNDEATSAVPPGYIPGSTEHKWSADAQIVFPTEPGQNIKLTSQSRGVRNLINDALRIIHLTIICESAWPERTSPTELTQKYLRLAAKSLDLDPKTDIYKRADKDLIFSAVISGLFTNRYSQSRLKARNEASDNLDKNYGFNMIPDVSQRSKYIKNLRKDKAFIYHIDLEKKTVDRSKPFVNDAVTSMLGRLTFAGGEKSLYRLHPDLFISELESKHEEFPGGMIAFVATSLDASLGEWVTGEHVASQTHFSLKNYQKRYQEFNGILDEEFNKSEDDYVTLMKTIFERARAHYHNAQPPAPTSKRPRKKPLQALGL
ncbi:hypothetical protein BDN72DRAFT_643635 [Pluteus cervinus]|uniref:Uncharacterized protein n=1 Tax=Pluteus cervinus TaxID=181527 RepID=A0ACD3A080_9AGAR|nr:hypothetical protein BDN72DRAFT_643635 [Pluteus cervinus]